MIGLYIQQSGNPEPVPFTLSTLTGRYDILLENWITLGGMLFILVLYHIKFISINQFYSSRTKFWALMVKVLTFK
jgi:hypothetical protein